MSAPNILFKKSEGVAEIILNRESKLNSVNKALTLELQQALAQVAEDREVRAVILTGAGRAFCAGQDLKEASFDAEGNPPPIKEIVMKTYNPIIRAIREMEKPFICAVNGIAAGAGANLALACDIVLASSTASFVQAFSQIGLIPDSGGTFMLPRLVGFSRAAALTMLAEPVSAKEAEEMGMIYKMYAPEALMPKARELAQKLAVMPTRAIGLTKRALNASANNGLREQLQLEADIQEEAGQTHDFKEGVMAFIQKRKPEFTGS